MVGVRLGWDGSESVRVLLAGGYWDRVYAVDVPGEWGCGGEGFGNRRRQMSFPKAVKVTVVREGKETEIVPVRAEWGLDLKRHPRLEVVLDGDAVLKALVEAHGAKEAMDGAVAAGQEKQPLTTTTMAPPKKPGKRS